MNKKTLFIGAATLLVLSTLIKFIGSDTAAYMPMVTGGLVLMWLGIAQAD